jgi:hypothetical protein
MAEQNVMAKAIGLPAGSLPPVDSLADGQYEITIVSVRDNNEMTLEYPNGWRRDHQAGGIEDLVHKIVNNLRARYGVQSVKTIQTCPLEQGGVIIVEVTT